MKPRLIPLQQWYCDTCGEVIESPEQGYVEWKTDPEPGKQGRAGFRIVHHALYSPRRASGKNCYYKNAERGGDNHLDQFLGPRGLIALTAWIDPGEEKEPDYQGPAVGDFREWGVLFRRLHLPYYEEARQFFEEALRDSSYSEANEIAFYMPETLKAVIEQYRETE